MIAIEDVLISDEIVQEQFVCNLNKCKGGCCVDGDAGAPLHKTELKEIEAAARKVWKDIATEGQAIIKQEGTYTHTKEFGHVTPVQADGMCVYAYRDEDKIVKCLFEKAYNAGQLSWKKPISCHLFPIKVKATKMGDLLNYEPREDLCKPACSLGKKLKVPVYQFLKEPLVRKYGEDFYEALHETALYMKSKKD
jgi:hypothetical protein